MRGGTARSIYLFQPKHHHQHGMKLERHACRHYRPTPGRLGPAEAKKISTGQGIPGADWANLRNPSGRCSRDGVAGVHCQDTSLRIIRPLQFQARQTRVVRGCYCPWPCVFTGQLFCGEGVCTPDSCLWYSSRLFFITRSFHVLRVVVAGLPARHIPPDCTLILTYAHLELKLMHAGNACFEKAAPAFSAVLGSGQTSAFSLSPPPSKTSPC